MSLTMISNSGNEDRVATVLKSFYKTSTYFLMRFRRMLGRSTLGVRAIVINNENKILLVKHTYQPGWYLPGGGVKKCESFQRAIVRELREEAGIQVLGAPSLFDIYIKESQGVCDYPVVFVVMKFNIFECRSYEIMEIGWFAANELPPDTTKATQRRVQEYFDKIPRSEQW